MRSPTGLGSRARRKQAAATATPLADRSCRGVLTRWVMVAAEAVRFQRTSTSPYPAGEAPPFEAADMVAVLSNHQSAAAWLRAPCDGPAFDANGGDGALVTVRHAVLRAARWLVQIDHRP